MTGFTSSIFFHGRDPEKRKSLVVVSAKVPGTILVDQSCQMPSFVCLFVVQGSEKTGPTAFLGLKDDGMQGHQIPPGMPFHSASCVSS